MEEKKFAKSVNRMHRILKISNVIICLEAHQMFKTLIIIIMISYSSVSRTRFGPFNDAFMTTMMGVMHADGGDLRGDEI